MKTLEFEGRLNPDGTVSLPAEVVEQFAPGQPFRVILLLDDSTEDEDWRRLTTEQFLKGYADCDAIYDQLSGG